MSCTGPPRNIWHQSWLAGCNGPVTVRHDDDDGWATGPRPRPRVPADVVNHEITIVPASILALQRQDGEVTLTAVRQLGGACLAGIVEDSVRRSSDHSARIGRCGFDTGNADGPRTVRLDLKLGGGSGPAGVVEGDSAGIVADLVDQEVVLGHAAASGDHGEIGAAPVGDGCHANAGGAVGLGDVDNVVPAAAVRAGCGAGTWERCCFCAVGRY